jgi:hypothetical protein
MKTMNVSLVGVGGQGILLTSDILAKTAALAGLDVKKSEIHGMAQRGGSVISQVRFGDKVYSPIIPDGTSDLLVSFERLEALRWRHLLARGRQGADQRHEHDAGDGVERPAACGDGLGRAAQGRVSRRALHRRDGARKDGRQHPRDEHGAWRARSRR